MNGTPKIFISYSRQDKDLVFSIKDEIEKLTGQNSCWTDLTGIESYQQFVDVTINAIDQSEVFLFMYSKYPENYSCTRKEISHATSKGKNIVFVREDTFNWIFCTYFINIAAVFCICPIAASVYESSIATPYHHVNPYPNKCIYQPLTQLGEQISDHMINRHIT